jgi:NitT/TauT family transport system substrate-binding protein
VACSPSSSSTASIKPEKADITVGATPAEGNVALYLALSRGIFAAHGLHVKIVIVQSTPVLVPSMESGRIDVAAGQIAGLLAAQTQGRAFKVLAAGLELKPGVNEIVTLKSSGITSLAGLKGKTILVNAPIGDGPLLTDSALATVGIKPAQVRYVTVAFPATATATWAKKYPRTAAAFSASIVAASRLADANPALVRKTVEASLAMPAQVTSAMPIGTFPAEVTAAKLRQVETLMLRSGQLTRPVDVTSLVTP